MPIALLLHAVHVADVQTTEDSVEEQLPMMLQQKVQEVR